MAIRHSIRRRPSAARPSPKSRKAPQQQARKAPDLDEILGHFCEGLALTETARTAIDVFNEDTQGINAGDLIGALAPPERAQSVLASLNGLKGITNATMTLARGLAELQRTYTELDLAIPHFRKGGAS